MEEIGYDDYFFGNGVCMIEWAELIALVEDGDEIEIDIPARVLKVNVSDEVLAQRKAKWQPPVQNLTGYLKRYAQHVTSGAQGAVFDD